MPRQTIHKRREILNSAHNRITLICTQYLNGLLTVGDMQQAMAGIPIPLLNGLVDPNTGLCYPMAPRNLKW